MTSGSSDWKQQPPAGGGARERGRDERSNMTAGMSGSGAMSGGDPRRTTPGGDDVFRGHPRDGRSNYPDRGVESSGGGWGNPLPRPAYHNVRPPFPQHWQYPIQNVGTGPAPGGPQRLSYQYPSAPSNVSSSYMPANMYMGNMPRQPPTPYGNLNVRPSQIPQQGSLPYPLGLAEDRSKPTAPPQDQARHPTQPLTSTPENHARQLATRRNTAGSRTDDEGVSFEESPMSDGRSRPTTADKASNSGASYSGGPTPAAAGALANGHPIPPVKLEPMDTKIDVDGDDGDDDDGDIKGDNQKEDHRKRKRNRTIRSCVPCHNHKRKCDRARPCGRCTALGLTGTCVYEIDEARDPNDTSYMEPDKLRRRIAELEQVVRELRQKTSNRPPALSTGNGSTIKGEPSHSDSVTVNEDDGYTRSRIVDRYARFKWDEANMAVVAANAAANGNGSAAIHGRGIEDNNPAMEGNLGRLVEPYLSHIMPSDTMVEQGGQTAFLGAPAGKSMLVRLRDLTSNLDPDLLTVPEDAAFTGWFPDQRKTFPFTTIWDPENFLGDILSMLPRGEQSEVVLQAFVDEVASFFQAWHLPTLIKEYRNFFKLSAEAQAQVPLCYIAVYIMICSLGTMIRSSIYELFGNPDCKWTAKGPQSPPPSSGDLTYSRLQSELYLSAAYQALRLCSFLSTPNIETLQAQVMINIYLLNSERAADSWALMGSLVRQCVAMGLHIDPIDHDPNMSIRDAEVRRRVWWTVVGLDCLLCVSFGRPSVATFWTTNLPQDITEERLSDVAGTARSLTSATGLNREVSEQTYHAAYFQISIPSLELLGRVFKNDLEYTRSPGRGYFKPKNKPSFAEDEDTYKDSLKLAEDIFQWYSEVPDQMRFRPDDDTADYLTSSRSARRVNQTLALCVKTFMLVLILHRPYLRADPDAFPDSQEICFKAAHFLLAAYRAMALTRSSIIWSWWTMSYRAFHAGTVCAFMAIREPGTELANKCLADLDGVVTVFEDRLETWKATHPVQADLCSGLIRLQRLAAAATMQAKGGKHGNGGGTRSGTPAPDTPRSKMRAFPPPSPSPSPAANPVPLPREPVGYMPPQAQAIGFTGDGFNGMDSVNLPTLWADMFAIDFEKSGQQSGIDTSRANPSGPSMSTSNSNSHHQLGPSSSVSGVPRPAWGVP